MKKATLTLLAAMTLLLSSCFSTGFGNTSSSNTTGNVLGAVLGSVLSNVLLGGMICQFYRMAGTAVKTVAVYSSKNHS